MPEASILAVVGARPNFVKMAPVTEALSQRDGVAVRLLHTGQHYDRALSDGFIERLGMPQPDANLGVGSGSHAEQTAAVLAGVEADLREHPAELVLVAGDVNSTMAAALAATKLNVAVGHVESGLRSRDWAMPEEVNRVVTDRVSDLLLCTSEDAVENLAAEGITEGVELVGNTMIDSLFRILEGADREAALAAQGVERGGYVLVTLHRPALVDDPAQAGRGDRGAGRARRRAAGPVPRPPAHRRPPGGGRDRGARGPCGMAEPMDYADFIALEAGARLVITDSGGRAGGDLGAGRPLPHLPDHHRAPGHRRAGHEHAGRRRPRGAARGGRAPRSPPSRRARPPQIPLWDGKAGVRAADAALSFLAR